MMFVFRLLIGLALIALLLPLGRTPGGGEASGSVDSLGALTAAGAALEDLGAFCDRQPQACATGAGALQAMGEHARAGARSLQDLIAEGPPAQSRTAPESGSAPPPEDSRSAPSLSDLIRKIAEPKPAAPAIERTRSQHTLRSGDLAPAWRQPQSKGNPG